MLLKLFFYSLQYNRKVVNKLKKFIGKIAFFAVVIKLLLAMNIPSKVSEVVLELCNCKLDLTDHDQEWLDFVLRHLWYHSFIDNMKFLNSLKIFL